MRQPLRKRQGWAVPAQLSFITILTFLNFGCASKPSTSAREELLQSRIRDLLASVEIEKSKTDTLNRTITRLENQLQNSRQKVKETKRFSGASPPVVKLRRDLGEFIASAQVDKSHPGDDDDFFEEVASTRSPRPAVTPTDGAESIADSSHEAMHFYFSGLKETENRDYEAALKSFGEFLKVAPNHVYADRAQYWLAQNFFWVGEQGLAIVQANRLEAKYPQSFRVPDGRLILALAHLESGQRNKGQEVLRSLLKDYPGTAAARTAATKLGQISRLVEPPPQLLTRETP